MSELKALVETLRGLSDQDLRSLVARRLVSLNNLDDFYDLAEALNSSKSYSAIVGSLGRNQLAALSKISKDEQVTDEEFESLKPLLLAYRDRDKVKTFAALLDQLKQHRAFTRALMVVPDLDDSPNQDTIDRNAGLAAFSTMQSLTELVFDVEKHLIREVGKGGVGLPDIKRLAGTLGKPNEAAKITYALAEKLGFTAINNSRHFLTGKALSWLEATQSTRLEILSQHFVALIGTELQKEFAELTPGTSLKAWLVGHFPLAELTSGSRIGQIVQTSELLGLTFQEHTSSWFASVLGASENIEKLMGENIPVVQDRVILQGDGTIIAPGPLTTGLESVIRKFASTESIGLASTYRLTSLSICHGLELGLSIAEISDVLQKASGKVIPQPIEYLLREVATRFGKLVITSSELGDHRSNILSDDNLLLTELGNDQRLRPFSFSRLAADRLACRFEPSVVYFGLRECGYLAIRKDSDGNVISPIETTNPVSEKNLVDKWTDAVERILKADLASRESGNDEAMNRQVQLAIRNKAKLAIIVNLPDGKQITIELVPSSIANGRLRGRDLKAQVERTLPLSTIEGITLA